MFYTRARLSLIITPIQTLCIFIEVNVPIPVSVKSELIHPTQLVLFNSPLILRFEK
jgi:hypothetical protein